MLGAGFSAGASFVRAGGGFSRAGGCVRLGGGAGLFAGASSFRSGGGFSRIGGAARFAGGASFVRAGGWFSRAGGSLARSAGFSAGTGRVAGVAFGRLGCSAGGLAAEGCAFLARNKRFRYIETRSGMKMSDNQAIAGGRAIVARNPSAPQLSSMNRANQSLSSCEIRRTERATSKIKSPNSVIKTRSNSMKTNARHMLKSPKNQEMDSRFFDRFLPTATDITPLVACASRMLALTQEQLLATRHSPVLTGSGPQTEMAVTYRKQTAAHILTGARIAHSETRARAKMNAEMSRIR